MSENQSLDLPSFLRWAAEEELERREHQSYLALARAIRVMRGGPLRVYTGNRQPADGLSTVIVSGDPLPLRLDLMNHSPTGFEWGYLGSGPAQLALAILADHFCAGIGMDPKKADALALRYYQRFKEEVIARIDTDVWTLDTDQIEVFPVALREEWRDG